MVGGNRHKTIYALVEDFCEVATMEQSGSRRMKIADANEQLAKPQATRHSGKGKSVVHGRAWPERTEGRERQADLI